MLTPKFRQDKANFHVYIWPDDRRFPEAAATIAENYHLLSGGLCDLDTQQVLTLEQALTTPPTSRRIVTAQAQHEFTEHPLKWNRETGPKALEFGRTTLARAQEAFAKVVMPRQEVSFNELVDLGPQVAVLFTGNFGERPSAFHGDVLARIIAAYRGEAVLSLKRDPFRRPHSKFHELLFDRFIWEWDTRKHAGEDADELRLLMLQTLDKRRVKFESLRRIHEEGEPSLYQPRTPIPESVQAFVFRRDGGRCQGCGLETGLCYDHIIPASRGGSSVNPANIRLLCDNCNQNKSDKIGELLFSKVG